MRNDELLRPFGAVIDRDYNQLDTDYSSRQDFAAVMTFREEMK
jgi:hypothetical protein